MHTAACHICKYTVTKPTQERAENAVKLHIGHMHKSESAVPSDSTALVPTTARRRGRPPGRRNGIVDASLEAAGVRPQAPMICFCPRCGLNLGVAEIAMRAASRMTR